MTIGLCRVTLYLPGVSSLKAKRSIIKRLLSKVRQKFNVSASEIGETDTWQKAILGVAVVANDSAFANSVISNVVNLFDADHQVEVLDCAIEMM